jgi:Ca2+-binding EF-hand superfamily protein
MSATSSPSKTLSKTASSGLEEVEVDLDELRKYPSIQEYYVANSKRDDVPITYQNGLSNYSSLVLGDDRIMFKESLMTSTFKPKNPMTLTDEQVRLRARNGGARKREYIDAVRQVGWEEVDRMEKNIRDKLNQRSFATSSPFQVRKSFKFFDTEKQGRLDPIGLTRALVFLGFEFSQKQVTALFARYDTKFEGLIDYMMLYNTCMAKDDDAPPVRIDTSHLGLDDDLGSRPGTSNSTFGEGSTLSGGGAFADEEAKNDDIRILQQAEVKRIFSMLDKTGADAIASEDFELLIMALNINLTPAELRNVKFELETPEAMIEFEDFYLWWARATSSRK